MKPVVRRTGAPKGGVDFGTLRQPFAAGASKTWVAMGVVGHRTQNPAYARISNGRVLVEVTLLPSGEEIVAALSDPAGGGGFGFYLPIEVGMRVVVGYPQGDDTTPTIVGRLNDATQPIPPDVAGLTTSGGDLANGEVTAPAFAFLRTPAGVLLAIETGPDGDVLIHSGGSIQLLVDASDQILLSGRTHIGSTVAFAEPPVGGVVVAGGAVSSSTSGANFEPAPNTNPINPPPTRDGALLPADGIMRMKDEVVSNSAVDTAFWVWLGMIDAAVTVMAASFNAPIGPMASLGPGAVIPPTPAKPDSLTCVGGSCSWSTCADE